MGRTPTTNNYHFPAQWLVAVKSCTVEANTCTVQGSHNLQKSQTITRLEINRTRIRGCYKMLYIYIIYDIIIIYDILYNIFYIYIWSLPKNLRESICSICSWGNIFFRRSLHFRLKVLCIFWYLVFFFFCGGPKKDLHPKTVFDEQLPDGLFHYYPIIYVHLYGFILTNSYQLVRDFAHPQLPLGYEILLFFWHEEKRK